MVHDKTVTYMHWKLRKIAFRVINLSTIVLPAWRKLLKELRIPDRIMPRDVTTCWNSTYDMLKFALEYCKAINILTADMLCSWAYAGCIFYFPPAY